MYTIQWFSVIHGIRQCRNVFITPEINRPLPVFSRALLAPGHRQSALHPDGCAYPGLHGHGLVQHAAFCAWLLSLSGMFPGPSRAMACVRTSLPVGAE